VRRSFGFWSMGGPRPGDIMIRPIRNNGVTVHMILKADLNFTGSDGNHFWEGEMVDIFPDLQAKATSGDLQQMRAAEILLARGLLVSEAAGYAHESADYVHYVSQTYNLKLTAAPK
jgi:hypothetical protein